MAVEIHVPGWCQVFVQQRTASPSNITALTELGRTRNGVTVSYEHFWYDVPGDEFGGDDGPPIDSQWLGSIARIRCEFTKYDRSLLFNVLGLFAGSTFGRMGAQNTAVKYPGNLIFSTNAYLRVLLKPQIGDTRNFPRCIIRSPHEQNYATKYASPIVEFEAHADELEMGDFVLHNTSQEAAFPGPDP